MNHTPADTKVLLRQWQIRIFTTAWVTYFAYYLGVFIMKYGYEFTFAFFGAAAIAGAMLVCVIWKAGPKTHTVE